MIGTYLVEPIDKRDKIIKNKLQFQEVRNANLIIHNYM